MAKDRTGIPATKQERTLDVDVLVLGGGPAGCWAAISAAESGASVLLVDKGYCGASGAAAAAGHGAWYVPPDPEAREEAMGSREGLGGFLADRDWAARVLDTTFGQINRLEGWGYPFPKKASFRRVDKDGHVNYGRGLQGPEYMRLMRRRVLLAGVKVWDHSPVLELLRTSDGVVSGARGISRQKGQEWRVTAGSVVAATGGVTFLSGALGCDVLTGEGHLMAAEVGAGLSGMEFSCAYAIAPAFSSITKTAYYRWATFTYEDGSVVEGAGWHSRSAIARALLQGPVYARLDQATPDQYQQLRAGQPNFFLAFDRAGIDPFTQRFPVTLRLEGTMRGTGGLQISDDDCTTTVPGLFAAGDLATRELICGGFTGGASHNAAWAISSGTFAGQGAARHALARRARPNVADLSSGEGIGIRPAASAGDRPGWREVVAGVQGEILPYDKNYFRTGDQLRRSLGVLDDIWTSVRDGLHLPAEDLLRGREAAGMTAVGRWMYNSALAREESRGMHKRLDRPQLDPSLQHRILVGGLDEIWTAPDPKAPVVKQPLVAA